ncbi:hypothetical protein M758_5G111700 [Ceratodon purpureus]|uniref:protein acetyllysine N-acetyltransferase n=1 Tax=Ceratodon purpureus TaxID=3225 RepID=A0A8T0I1L8_CERPU|nr:hypothetical protein KC19_5G117800 [Ceratodon purpureus]KAG0616396.1 hypothetical protein M758_5G111700 [Ceratodon purpureus]
MVPDVEADLAIVLGTSLKVSPANDLPLTTANRGKPLVIVNLQRTPLDRICSLRIFAKTDEVMAMLAEKLGMEIPPPRDVAAASGNNSQRRRHSEGSSLRPFGSSS